jgi:hypothetical protein
MSVGSVSLGFLSLSITDRSSLGSLCPNLGLIFHQ